MRAIKIEAEKGKPPVITTEEVVKRLFRKPIVVQRRFLGTDKICDHYFGWLELPEKKLVPDLLSFQLDAWLKSGISE